MKCEKCGTEVDEGDRIEMLPTTADRCALGIYGNPEPLGYRLDRPPYIMDPLTGQLVPKPPDPNAPPLHNQPFVTGLSFWDQRLQAPLTLCGACVCDALRAMLGLGGIQVTGGTYLEGVTYASTYPDGPGCSSPTIGDMIRAAADVMSHPGSAGKVAPRPSDLGVDHCGRPLDVTGKDAIVVDLIDSPPRSLSQEAPAVPSPQLVIVGNDGRCRCSCADRCPLGRTSMETRCTRAELEAVGVTLVLSHQRYEP